MSLTFSPLKESVEFIRGITFKPDDKVEPGTPDSVVCMRTKNIQRDIDQDDLIAVPSSFVSKKEKYLSEGDILISSANSWELVGKCCYVPALKYLATAGGFISVIRAKDGVDPRYLYHWLTTPQTLHNARHCGRQTTNISNLDVERFLGLDFPKVALEEQLRIATILDKTDAIRRKREQTLTLTDDFLRSAFLDTFGDPGTNPNKWDIVLLSEIIRTDDRVNYGVVQPGENVEDGKPIIRVGDFDNGTIDRTGLKRIALEIEEQYQRSRLTGDEILVSCVGSVGLIALADKSLKGMNIVRAVARVPLMDGIVREYVATYLNTEVAQRHFRKETRTVSQPTLNISLILDTPVLLPPYSEQIKFKAIFDALKKHSEDAEQALSDSNQLFQSISQRAFRGGL